MDLSGDRVALAAHGDAAERAKWPSPSGSRLPIQLPFLALRDGAARARDGVVRDELEELVRPLVDRTLDVCREVLAAKNLTTGDIDEVLLVGGQSRMPLVHERARGLLRQAALRAVHPDEAVAIGAALLANSPGRADRLVLIDVLAHVDRHRPPGRTGQADHRAKHPASGAEAVRPHHHPRRADRFRAGRAAG